MLNTSTKQVVATIPVGVNGNDVAVNHANAKVYVTSDDGVTGTVDRVSVIDGTSNRVITTIPVGLFPSAVGVHMYSNQIYVTNSGADTVSVIDGTSNRVITTIHVGQVPRAVAVNQYNGNVFATNIRENTVSVIDGISNRVIDTIHVGDNPWKVAVNAAKDKVYVTNRDSSTVSAILKESPAACPTRNFQHWDKIVFKIVSSDLAQKLSLAANTELDIKVQDDPNKVADIKQKVFDFLKVPYASRYGIEIIDVNYAIVCASPAVSENIIPAKPTANITKVPSTANATGLR
ncbi:MAG: YncE family protein [Nitrososphaeraceae archaeon]